MVQSTLGQISALVNLIPGRRQDKIRTFFENIENEQSYLCLKAFGVIASLSFCLEKET